MTRSSFSSTPRFATRVVKASLAVACLAFGMAHAAVLSTSFTVSGDVSKVTTFDLTALQNSPLTKITQTVGTSTYVGVSFWDLLTVAVGVPVDPSIKNNILDKYVVATGTDGYQSVFSLGELNPSFGNQPDIIAYQLNGGALTTDGFARVVVPNDVKAGRFVSNLVSLQVFTVAPAVPEPASDALMLIGIVAVGGVARSKAKAKARRSTH